MLLTANMGNTAISFALFEGGKLSRMGRVQAADWQRLTDAVGAAPVTSAIIGSVTPSRTDAVASLLRERLGVPVAVAGRDVKWGIDIRCDKPETVGADRILNAIAAYRRMRGECIVADVGTAITVDLVGQDGAFLGGAIAPGPMTMLRSLANFTEQLPLVALQQPPSAIGRNTTDAIRSGVYWGAIGLVQSLITRIASDLGRQPPVIVTGGDGEFVARHLQPPAEFVPALTHEGLAILDGGRTLEGSA